MNKKLLIGLVIAAGALLVLSAIIALVVTLRYKPATPDADIVTDQTTDTTTNQNSSNGTTTTTTTTTQPNSDNSTTATTSTTDETRIVSLANSFTERYGSYSSDTDFENVEALRSFMTDTMSQSADVFIKQPYPTAEGEFYGITTQTANVKITDYTEGASGATVEVDTRRTETKGINEAIIFSEKARLQFKKVSDSWKVDRFQWL